MLTAAVVFRPIWFLLLDICVVVLVPVRTPAYYLHIDDPEV